MHNVRAFALLGVLGFSILATGCSSNSGSGLPATTPGTMPAPQSSAQPSATTAASTTTQSYTLVGKITYSTFFASSGEFQVKNSSGTAIWVYTNSSTQWTKNGLTLAVGQYAGVNGTFKSSTAVNASGVTLSTSDPSSGATPAPGSTPGSVATPVPVSGIPKHVQTAEYLQTSTELATNPSTYAPYLSWAYTTNGRLGLVKSAGIHTVVYTSPVMPFHNTYEYNQLSGPYTSARATTCGGGVITTYSGNGLLSDPTKSSATAYYQSVVNNEINAVTAANPGYSHPWDLIFIDNDGPLYGASSMPCNYNDNTWSTAQDAALATTGQKFILNSLSVAPTNVPTFVNRLSGSAVGGGEFEECFMTALWSSEGDAQLQTVALMKSQGKAAGAGFWCYANNTTASGASSIAQRNYIYASWLLTYDPYYSVFQESFTTPSTFKVMPETGFVPMSPVSAPTSVSQLQTSTGAYMRQYNSCYYRGSLIGRCEVIANPSATSSVSVPNPWGLGHSMVLSGNGVLDGGTVTFNGSVPSTMGPKSGIVLVP